MSQAHDQNGGTRIGGLCGRYGAAAAVAALLAVAGLQGCENTGQGAVTGAGLGALTGLAIGSMSGNAGAGAAIGAIGGGVAGGAIGNQNQRQRANTDAIVASNNNRPQPIVVQQAPNGGIAIPGGNSIAGMSQNDRERLALARFARNWSVSGWETVGGQRVLVTGSASGSVANAFFVRLDVIVREDQSGRVNTGSIVFASEPGRGLTMNSRFDTSPSPVTYAGTVSDDGNLFTLEEVAPGFATGRRVVIRFLSNEQWVADETERVAGQNVAVGSLTFSGAR